MKIEIDFEKPDEMRRLRGELEMALATLEGALLAMDKRKSATPSATLPLPLPPQPNSASNPYPRASAVIDSLPQEFTMRDALASARSVGVPTPRIRREVARRIENQTLIMIAESRGRIPASFRKA